MSAGECLSQRDDERPAGCPATSLSRHVLGSPRWKDPFSLEAATSRQDRYGRRFGDGSYTPEMVVDGGVGLVESRRDEVNAAIEQTPPPCRG
ncbi:DUF1223 domain-containing protein [Bradyrhizobium sp. AZCC 1577]|uniref:DUF1223 domain-containing protein n=1 Tax=Bradyrhizobium sp. AZCC 1577 TaxID=3117019 RepID=UPI003FA53DD1